MRTRTISEHCTLIISSGYFPLFSVQRDGAALRSKLPMAASGLWGSILSTPQEARLAAPSHSPGGWRGSSSTTMKRRTPSRSIQSSSSKRSPCSKKSTTSPVVLEQSPASTVVMGPGRRARRRQCPQVWRMPTSMATMLRESWLTAPPTGRLPTPGRRFPPPKGLHVPGARWAPGFPSPWRQEPG